MTTVNSRLRSARLIWIGPSVDEDGQVEPLRQPVLLVHRSPSLAASRHSSDERGRAHVTARAPHCRAGRELKKLAHYGHDYGIVDVDAGRLGGTDPATRNQRAGVATRCHRLPGAATRVHRIPPA